MIDLNSLKFPKLQKQKIKLIDKDSIPQKKIDTDKVLKMFDANMARDILKKLYTPYILEPGEICDLSWIDKLSDEDAIEMCNKISDALKKKRDEANGD